MGLTGRIVTDCQPYSGSDWSYRYGLSALQWVRLVVSLQTVSLTVGLTGHIVMDCQPYSGSDWSYHYRLSALQWV